MLLSFRSIALSLFVAYLQIAQVKAADCTVAIVGSPFSTCFDIYTNAKITQAEFNSYNPGLNCALLQIGQQVCVSPGTLPSLSPAPQPNGTCAEYTTISGDSCSAIATKFHITVAQIENFNVNTYKWKGCGALQVAFTLCVSTGNPPPIPINPLLQCGPETAGNQTCPLRACCSAFGFCGTTADFCATTGANPCISNCIMPTLPSCSTSQTLRNIAYYAGWGNRRANCSDNNVSPDQLDFTGYTHAHFAFATISQALAIQVTSDDDVLLRQLVAQKARYPGLKVLIAVGGWDFSETDATKDLFTFMIATSTSRATFINSIKAFLTSYGLDGIDIDFEYPGAIERNAPAEDTPNLTSFFSELKTALPGTAIISVATPAGYWFLKGFEIDKIAGSVTYMNMMSYDYHGQWDTNITGQAPVTNPHTSILDMQDSVLLYVRAGIDMSKVNLGLAWYGRTYHLANPSCSGYNCTMVGGGDAGLCSQAIGYLAQFEISSLVANGADPHLDSSTQTYWLDNAGDLVTFDQTDTWKAKSTFAAQTCFGGTFVWSIDQIMPVGLSGPPVQVPLYTEITWNPNPYPPPTAASETFIQTAGTITTVVTSTLGISTQTFTRTVMETAWTDTSTLPQGGTTTIIHPPSALVLTSVGVATSTAVTTVTALKTATTLVIPMPTATTSVTIGGVVLTLQPQGTPINSPLPPYITEVSGITPTWTLNILPPPSATKITFTAPLTASATWSTVVFVPTSTTTTVQGPTNSDDNKPNNRCKGITLWSILSGGIIGGCLPPFIGIVGGITPVPVPPLDWTGVWIPPFTLETGQPPANSPTPTTTGTSSTSSSSTSTSSTTTCSPTQDVTYDLPADPPDNSDDGTDQDELRKRAAEFNPTPRTMKIPVCPAFVVTSPQIISLGAAEYYTVRFAPASSTFLEVLGLSSRGDRPAKTLNQEHVFEIGYISQFVTDPTGLNLGEGNCTWIMDNLFSFVRADGSTMGASLLAAIDRVENMVWVDIPMNQAKSNVVNRNKLTAGDPPQSKAIKELTSLTDQNIPKVELFIRSFAALGIYFRYTGDTFRNTAINVQNLLAELTPTTVLNPTMTIPLLFNMWLRDTLSQYPDGCTSRAENSYNYYKNKMNALSGAAQSPVPSCYGLFWAPTFTASSFDYNPLIPAAPNPPRCMVPGTKGGLGYKVDGSGIVPPLLGHPSVPDPAPILTILGSGNTDIHSIGAGLTGPSAGDVFQLYGLGGPVDDPCLHEGYQLFYGPPGTLGTPLGISFSCDVYDTTQGRQSSASFSLNGNPMNCVFFMDSSGVIQDTNCFPAPIFAQCMNSLTSTYTKMAWDPYFVKVAGQI